MSLLEREAAAFNQGVRDEIVVLENRGDSAVYARSGDPERRAGELHLEARDGAIVRLRVLYEQ
jgi:hypothetical protein